MNQPPPAPTSRSRRAIAAWCAGTYVAAWLLAVGIAALGAATADDSKDWDDLGRAIVGFLAGALIGHVAWGIVVARLLAPYGRTGRIVATIVATPILVIVGAGALAGLFPLSVIPLLAIPAGLSWWAAEPPAALAP